MPLTLLVSLTSCPTSTNPAQLAGCWKYFVVCTAVIASARALDTLEPCTEEITKIV